MSALPRLRFQTGDVCQRPGRYAFDGYVDGRWNPKPLFVDELNVRVAQGDRFPRLISVDKPCCWMFVNEIEHACLLETRSADGHKSGAVA